ncbi:MAG: hypothetical protein QXO37_09560 [Candidatus Nitrosocaldaceae archaeon]
MSTSLPKDFDELSAYITKLYHEYAQRRKAKATQEQNIANLPLSTSTNAFTSELSIDNSQARLAQGVIRYKVGKVKYSHKYKIHYKPYSLSI